MEDACGEISSVESYFISKKVYMDRLESVDRFQKKIQTNHIRMKGIPTSCVKHKSKEMEIDPMEIYEQLYKGERLNFDLTEDDNKCGFKYEKDLSVRSCHEGEFTRSLAFCAEVERIEIT